MNRENDRTPVYRQTFEFPNERVRSVAQEELSGEQEGTLVLTNVLEYPEIFKVTPFNVAAQDSDDYIRLKDCSGPSEEQDYLAALRVYLSSCLPEGEALDVSGVENMLRPYAHDPNVCSWIAEACIGAESDVNPQTQWYGQDCRYDCLAFGRAVFEHIGRWGLWLDPAGWRVSNWGIAQGVSSARWGATDLTFMTMGMPFSYLARALAGRYGVRIGYSCRCVGYFGTLDELEDAERSGEAAEMTRVSEEEAEASRFDLAFGKDGILDAARM